MLTDEEMREVYNKHGEEGLKNKGQHGGHGDMFRYIDSVNYWLLINFPFSSFFGGGGFNFHFGGHGDHSHREIPRGGTIVMEIEVHIGKGLIALIMRDN